jgi:hypothetical protein
VICHACPNWRASRVFAVALPRGFAERLRLSGLTRSFSSCSPAGRLSLPAGEERVWLGHPPTERQCLSAQQAAKPRVLACGFERNLDEPGDLSPPRGCPPNSEDLFCSHGFRRGPYSFGPAGPEVKQEADSSRGAGNCRPWEARPPRKRGAEVHRRSGCAPELAPTRSGWERRSYA